MKLKSKSFSKTLFKKIVKGIVNFNVKNVSTLKNLKCMISFHLICNLKMHFKTLLQKHEY